MIKSVDPLGVDRASRLRDQHEAWLLGEKTVCVKWFSFKFNHYVSLELRLRTHQRLCLMYAISALLSSHCMYVKETVHTVQLGGGGGIQINNSFIHWKCGPPTLWCLYVIGQTSMKSDCPAWPLIALSPDHHVLVRVYPVALPYSGPVPILLLYILYCSECQPHCGSLNEMVGTYLVSS